MYENNEDKKNEYWNHFICYIKETKYKLLTFKRLEIAKKGLWNDIHFWDDILLRHNGINQTPEEMKLEKNFSYQHMIGNMIGMITQHLVEIGKIKP